MADTASSVFPDTEGQSTAEKDVVSGTVIGRPTKHTEAILLPYVKRSSIRRQPRAHEGSPQVEHQTSVPFDKSSLESSEKSSVSPSGRSLPSSLGHMKLGSIDKLPDDKPKSSPIKRERSSSPSERQSAPRPAVVDLVNEHAKSMYLSQHHRLFKSSALSHVQTVNLVDRWEHELWKIFLGQVSDQIQTHAGEWFNKSKTDGSILQPLCVLKDLLNSGKDKQQVEVPIACSIETTECMMLGAYLLNLFLSSPVDSTSQRPSIPKAEFLTTKQYIDPEWFAQDTRIPSSQIRDHLRRQLLQHLHDNTLIRSVGNEMAEHYDPTDFAVKSEQKSSSGVGLQALSDIKVEGESESSGADLTETAVSIKTEARPSLNFPVSPSSLGEIEIRGNRGSFFRPNEESHSYMRNTKRAFANRSVSASAGRVGHSLPPLKSALMLISLPAESENLEKAQLPRPDLRSRGRRNAFSCESGKGSAPTDPDKAMPAQIDAGPALCQNEQQRDASLTQQMPYGKGVASSAVANDAVFYTTWHDHQSLNPLKVSNYPTISAKQSHYLDNYSKAPESPTSTFRQALLEIGGVDKQPASPSDSDFSMGYLEPELLTSSGGSACEKHRAVSHYIGRHVATLRYWLCVQLKSESLLQHLQCQVAYKQFESPASQDQPTDSSSKPTSESSSSASPTASLGGHPNGSKRSRDTVCSNNEPLGKKRRVTEDHPEPKSMRKTRLGCFYNKYDPIMYRSNDQTGMKFETCGGRDFPDMDKLFGHLKRTHSDQPVQCARCARTDFRTPDELREHQMAPEFCVVTPLTVKRIQWLSDDQRKALQKKVAKERRGCSAEEKWKFTYSTLFPEVGENDIPDAFFQNPIVSIISFIVEDYETRLRAEIRRSNGLSDLERRLPVIREQLLTPWGMTMNGGNQSSILQLSSRNLESLSGVESPTNSPSDPVNRSDNNIRDPQNNLEIPADETYGGRTPSHDAPNGAGIDNDTSDSWDWVDHGPNGSGDAMPNLADPLSSTLVTMSEHPSASYPTFEPFGVLETENWPQCPEFVLPADDLFGGHDVSNNNGIGSHMADFVGFEPFTFDSTSFLHVSNV